MFQETDGDAGKTIWIWRFLLWADNSSPKFTLMQLALYDKHHEEVVWEIDITFWKMRDKEGQG